MSSPVPGSVNSPETRPGPRRRRRHFLWNTAGVAVAVIGIVTILTLWANSNQFEDLVRRRLAAQIQNATGGRVEIGSFHWHLFQLEATANNVVIHGDEPPGEAPYAQIKSLRVRLSIFGFWSPRIFLRDLEVAQPQIHLIFYRDGATNQPHPAHPPKTTRSGTDTLFDLRANRITVEQGVLDLDNRAANLDLQNRYEPLDLRGDDVSLVMQYNPASAQAGDSYHIDASIRDLNLARGGSLAHTVPPVHGYLQASLDFARDAVNLRSLRVTARTPGAKDRSLDITGSLAHFAHPRWASTIQGDLDLRLLDPVFGYTFAPEGVAHLDLSAGGEGPAFHIDGSIHAQQASYIGTGVLARGIDLTARVHADADDLRITSIAARLHPGGEIDGEVLLNHWLPPAAPDTLEAAPPVVNLREPMRKKLGTHPHQPGPPPPPSQIPPHSTLLKRAIVDIPVNGKVNADFRNVSLDTILDMVGQQPFQRLGLATLVNGPAHAVWVNGDVSTLSVSSTLALNPSAQPAPGEVPTQGALDATYTQHDGAVEVRSLTLDLPDSHIDARGRLGAYPLTSPTALNVNLHSRNLAEFDAVLRDLGLTSNGKSGVAALPVSLEGQADFHGSWAGSLLNPRLAGNLKATSIALALPPGAIGNTAPQTIRWDSIDADGSYDAAHIAIVRAQLQRGSAHIELDGTLSAPPQPTPALTTRQRAAAPTPNFDANSLLHLRAHASKVDLADLLPLLGTNLPVTGSLDAQLNADGPIRALNGSGWMQLNNGVVYGQPVSSIRAEGSVANPVLKLTSIWAKSPAGSITGSGTYDFRANRILAAQAAGANIDVARLQSLSAWSDALSGKLDFQLTASGTPSDPSLEGRATLAGLTVRGDPLGTLSVTAHSAGRTLLYDAATRLDNAELTLHGQTETHGDYATQASLNFSRFDIGSVFKLAHIQGIGAESALSGEATLQGPLARPKEIRGDLRVQQVAVTVSGVHLQSEGGVHASLANERVILDPLHITGDLTDLRAQGSLELHDAKRLDLAASGSVNLKLAETLDPDVTAGGTSTFEVEAHGPLANPGLRGRVQFDNGSLALEDLSNGLSQLHGTLEFNQNRLEVKSLTAMTGGGQLSLGGYLAYQHGIYADLSVTGKSIRIRYPEGISSLADADLHLQGTQSNLLLSGNILITRFSISPDLDIAALATQASGVEAIAPPDAPSNHVRLNVHVQSSPQLNFQNAYAKLAGDVDLRLRGTVASPSLLGRISITEGNAVIAGTRYELQRGDITFTNPVRIQPTIDLNATARVEDYDITLGVHGTTDSPMSITYRSDPPLPEADVIALLALGRTQSEQGLYTQQQQQSAGLNPSTDVLLGGALNATVSSRVQKLFGAGSVKVDPSYLGALGNSTTRITVDEQLGKYVTLTYATNVDTSAQQLIQAEVAVNRHVSIVVARDESGVFSMVVKAIRRYR